MLHIHHLIQGCVIPLPQGLHKSFSFNTKDNTCELYDVLPVDFFDNCNVLGVPKDTDVEACPSAANTDQCVVSIV